MTTVQYYITNYDKILLDLSHIHEFDSKGRDFRNLTSINDSHNFHCHHWHKVKIIIIICQGYWL